MRKARTYTVIDRESRELRDAGLTAREVLDQHVPVGSQSAAMPLIGSLRKVGSEITLGDIVVRYTGVA
jgi:hypothetical protein